MNRRIERAPALCAAACLTAALLIAVSGCGKQGNEGRAGESAPGGATNEHPAGAVPAGDSGRPVSTGDGNASAGGALSEGGSMPEGHPPVPSGGIVQPPPLGSGEGEAALHWTDPEAWVAETPKGGMRRAQYRVPRAPSDAEDGECTVFYFGPKQGGSAEANASRWTAQFQQPDGSPAKSKMVMRTAAEGVDAMFVEVKGTFTPMAMPGKEPSAPKPGYALLGAIVPGPDAPWFFKCTGPEKTMVANRDPFEKWIASIRHGGA